MLAGSVKESSFTCASPSSSPKRCAILCGFLASVYVVWLCTHMPTGCCTQALLIALMVSTTFHVQSTKDSIPPYLAHAHANFIITLLP